MRIKQSQALVAALLAAVVSGCGGGEARNDSAPEQVTGTQEAPLPCEDCPVDDPQEPTTPPQTLVTLFDGDNATGIQVGRLNTAVAQYRDMKSSNEQYIPNDSVRSFQMWNLKADTRILFCDSSLAAPTHYPSEDVGMLHIFDDVGYPRVTNLNGDFIHVWDAKRWMYRYYPQHDGGISLAGKVSAIRVFPPGVDGPRCILCNGIPRCPAVERLRYYCLNTVYTDPPLTCDGY